MTTGTRDCPTPTTEWDKALEDFTEYGVCIVENALDSDLLKEVHTALYRAAETDVKYGRKLNYIADGEVAQRVWNLPSRDPVFCALAEHPLAMHFVEKVIGWPALLNNMSANITSMGSVPMVIHADQEFAPTPWARPHGVNVAWFVDEFTAGNGGTRYIPRSHTWSSEEIAEIYALPPQVGHEKRNRLADKLVAAEGPAGSAMIMDGRTLHTNGENTNGAPRAGIFGFYTLPVYVPQENWAVSIDLATRQFASETVQTLLGFRPKSLGRANGHDRF